MLGEYKGKITVKIDGLAASAASVIAMAGNSVLMSPTSLMMIHNPLTVAIGDSEEMRRAQDMLDEVKQSIINAYQIRSKQPRAKISDWMDAETWMNANKAIELGFADGLLEGGGKQANPAAGVDNFVFSRRAVTNSLLEKMNIQRIQPANTAPTKTPEPPATPNSDVTEPSETKTPASTGVCAESLNKRLFLIPHQNTTQRR
jgi:ATP-dependent Clp protease protease subunit